MGSADFWNSQDAAQEVVQQVKSLKNWVEPFEALVSRVQTTRELNEMLAGLPGLGRMKKRVDKAQEAEGRG